jgi:DNA invertase Pin-like site-specific DNA recombinase
MTVVIYARYSSELQNPKSIEDQVREVKEGLARLGIDASNAEVVRDAAISGTSSERDGFDMIRERLRRRQSFILAVDDANERL